MGGSWGAKVCWPAPASILEVVRSAAVGVLQSGPNGLRSPRLMSRAVPRPGVSDCRVPPPPFSLPPTTGYAITAALWTWCQSAFGDNAAACWPGASQPYRGRGLLERVPRLCDLLIDPVDSRGRAPAECCGRCSRHGIEPISHGFENSSAGSDREDHLIPIIVHNRNKTFVCHEQS